MLPELKGSTVQLRAIGIGEQEAAATFADKVGFPVELLYADAKGETYKEIGFYKELGRLFFARATREAFKDTDKQERVKEMLSVYKPQGLIPKDTSLTVQQGGMLVVKGGKVLLAHFDQGTGAHADWSEVLKAAKGK